MGTFRHNAIVVTGWKEDQVLEAHKVAETLNLNPSEIKGPFFNNYMSFFIPPDGSKEGWEHSNECNELRDQWIKAAQELDVDWVEVSFGEFLATIVRDSRQRELNL
jgi:hypothetical protein